MQIATLGPLTVSRLCLGTMLMGGATPAKEAHLMLDRFLEAGGTFIDTADVYGDGESERTLAPWLARHRDEVVLATKVRFSVSDPGGEGLDPERIRAACDASLRRLGVDVIDLYQVHAPDPKIPLEDSLTALDRGSCDSPARWNFLLRSHKVSLLTEILSLWQNFGCYNRLFNAYQKSKGKVMNESLVKKGALAAVTIGCHPGAELRFRVAVSRLLVHYGTLPILNRWRSS